MSYKKTLKHNYGGDRDFPSQFVIPKDIKNNALLGHIEKGVLYLNGEVNDEMADYVQDSLMLLSTEPPKEGILTAKISSPGGDVRAGLKIHDLLMLYTYETGVIVKGLAIGEAFSAASTFLLQGCAIRMATENCTIMCHNALALDFVTEHDLKSVGWHMRLLRELETVKQKMITILKRRTKRSEQDILKMLVRGRDMTAKEAKEFGLLDGVLEFVFQEEKTPTKRRASKSAV